VSNIKHAGVDNKSTYLTPLVSGNIHSFPERGYLVLYEMFDFGVCHGRNGKIEYFNRLGPNIPKQSMKQDGMQHTLQDISRMVTV
jgi:hypothetical protein